MGESLRIQVIVDGSQVTAGMSQVGSVVTSAEEAIAAATLRHASAQNTLRDVIQQYVRGDLPSLAAATKMVAAAQEEAALAALVLQRATGPILPQFKAVKEEFEEIPAPANAA